MGSNLTLCPSIDELERLLAEDLRGPDRDAAETHIEHCTRCQEELARLSDTDFPAITSQRGVAAESVPEPKAGFLLRLQQLPHSTLLAPNLPSDEKKPSMATRPAPMARFPGGRIGRYEIIEKLASGGMGVVYKARHIDLGKVVALKVLPEREPGEVDLARFKNEMRAIGGLDHPHVVAAHDAGDADGIHYLAMDLVDGIDLSRLVRHLGRLPVADACEAIRQAALGLQAAFERGLVHRDIKPSNLILGRNGLVQLLDLGLARTSGDAHSERLTSTGALLGTADYLAPEQWEQPHAADIRADIYGLGCTLYHLLAGRPPFAGDHYKSVLHRMRAHQEEMPQPITESCNPVPAALAAVLDRMLAKSPEDRCATPAEVAEALRPFANGADLVRLVNAAGSTAAAPAEAAATPGPATFETSPVSRSRHRPAERRRYIWFAAAVAVMGLMLLAALFLWPKKENGPGSLAKGLAIRDMRLTLFRYDGRESLGDLRTSTSDVRVNDSVAVAAEFNVPAHYYLIAFNPAGSKEGTEQLCQPDDEHSLPQNVNEVRYPQKDFLFSVLNPGLQAFVLAASSKPLLPYKEWRDLVGDIPWTGKEDAGKVRWHFDGNEFDWVPQRRGQVIKAFGAPKPLLELKDWFKQRPEFEVVQIFAFPVTNNQK